MKDILFHPGFYFFLPHTAPQTSEQLTVTQTKLPGRFSLQLVKLLWAEDEL